MDGSKTNIAGETPATAYIPWWARALIYALAGALGLSVAVAYALAPNERELDLIEYGKMEGEQAQLHQENLNDDLWLEEQTRMVRERQAERSEQWGQIEAEQVKLYEELFL